MWGDAGQVWRKSWAGISGTQTDRHQTIRQGGGKGLQTLGIVKDEEDDGGNEEVERQKRCVDK